jgi:flagellar assembly factor FliW
LESQAKTIATPRFGEVTFTADDVFDFPWGLPGFSHLRHFLALSLDDQPHFVWLQSTEDPSVALPAADPWRVFPDYEPKLPPYAIESLGVQSSEDFTVLGIVVVTKDAEEMTINLMAPVVVNLKTRVGRQVMLENSGYSVRTPLPRKAVAQPA